MVCFSAKIQESKVSMLRRNPTCLYVNGTGFFPGQVFVGHSKGNSLGAAAINRIIKISCSQDRLAVFKGETSAGR